MAIHYNSDVNCFLNLLYYNNKILLQRAAGFCTVLIGFIRINLVCMFIHCEYKLV